MIKIKKLSQGLSDLGHHYRCPYEYESGDKGKTVLIKYLPFTYSEQSVHSVATNIETISVREIKLDRNVRRNFLIKSKLTELSKSRKQNFNVAKMVLHLPEITPLFVGCS